MPAPSDLTPPDPSSLLQGLQFFGVNLGLETCRRRLEALGSPHLTVPTVLIAGTNGKGSTASFLAAMGTAAGYRTGLFTSPHLESVEERIRLDGVTIPSGTLGGLLHEILPEVGEHRQNPITYFEALTIAAYLYFARENVDLAIFEVGLGGRLDATNVGEPILSIISSIGLDHQAYLGESLSAIAREKAGILRPGMPAVCSIDAPMALATVREVAAKLDAPLVSALEEVRWKELRSRGWEGQQVHLSTPHQDLDLEIALLGEHQVANLALAVRGAEILERRGFSRLTAQALRRGAGACRWPGRLEVVELPGNRRVLFDAAHNVDSARRLRGFLDTVEDGLHLLFGILEDKDARGILATLAPHFSQCVLTRPESPRARSPKELPPMLPRGLRARVKEPVEEALDTALHYLFEGEATTLVVCGSIYLVGAIRGLLQRRFGVPIPAVEILTGPLKD